MEGNESLETNSPNVPTHILVQKQLQDLIETQKAAAEFKLKQDVTLQEFSITNSYVPKTQYDMELNRLQESLREDYVTKDQYEAIVKQLEEERIAHGQTKAMLREVTDKLEFALGEVEIITKQLEREKAAYDTAFGTMRKKAIQESTKSLKLETKCSEIVKECEIKEDILNNKVQKIESLEKKLKEQEQLYKKQLTEQEIQRKQQQYINKILEEQDRKKCKSLPQSVPKTKTQRR